MPVRPVGSATISFGLVSIPVKLYTATSSQTVRFHYLHPKCGGRVRYRMVCPVDDEVLDRKDLVKGYEYAKDQYVQFTAEELKALEAERTESIEIVEFVPLASVDLIHVEKSMYLGPDKGGNKAYRLLAQAMEETGKVAVGRYAARGKEQLVIIRPYRDGLLLHDLYFADEVNDFKEVPLGDAVELRPGEAEMAGQLIEHLSKESFAVDQFKDHHRERILAAIEQKVAGHEVTVAPEQPAAQIVDLFEALKASLAAAGRTEGAEEIKPQKKAEPRASGKKRSAG